MKRISLFLLTLMLVLLLTSCGKSEDDERKYTVNFDSQGGSSVETIIVEGYKSKIGNLEIPTKTGYIFDGWYPSLQFLAGTEVTTNSLIGKDLTLYAKWTPIQLVIEYGINEGTPKVAFDFSKNKYDYDSIINLPHMEKEEYLFSGWVDEQNNKLPFEYKVTQSSKIIANFIPLSSLESNYSINYELNGGGFYVFNSEADLIDEFLSDIDSTTWNETITIDNLLTSNRVRFTRKDGFFNGYWWWMWFIDFLKAEYAELSNANENQFYSKMIEVLDKVKNNEFDRYHPSDSIENTMIKAEVYAFFTNAKYEYQFNETTVSSLNYKDVNIKKRMWEYITLEVDTTYSVGENTEFSIPYQAGYTFEGWYLDSEYTKPIEYIDETMYGDITVYAKWSKN